MKKIFIFDAYAPIRELLAEDLVVEGNMIVAIGKPEFVGEAVAAFCPDLIILDLYVRGGIRWDLLEDLKSRYPAVPILLFTAFHPQEMPRLNRADAWVKKSFVFGDLKQKVRDLLAAKGDAERPDNKIFKAKDADGSQRKLTFPCCH